MAILFVPSYVKILGIEAYGLIGFYTLVQMFLTIFDHLFGHFLPMDPIAPVVDALYKASGLNRG